MSNIYQLRRIKKIALLHPTVTQHQIYKPRATFIYNLHLANAQFRVVPEKTPGLFFYKKKVWIEKGQRKALSENHARNTVKKIYCNTDASEIACTCGLCGVAHNTGMIKVQRK